MKVFYDFRQNARKQALSPSSAKPSVVRKDWFLNFGQRLQNGAVEAVNRDQLKLVHTDEYVDGVLDRTVNNGFGNRDATVAASLPWTVGSFVSAARHAYLNKTFAASPTSGFHHACPNEGGGFCTFNGLAVAVRVLRQQYGALKFAILDLDNHYGDGTAECLDDLLGRGEVLHYTRGVPGYTMADTFENHLTTIKDFLLQARIASVGAVLFQAGADAHINDPYGGQWTDEQLAERDETVFKTAGNLELPVAWNLAGGYQQDESKKDFSESIEPVVRIHRATMAAALSHLPIHVQLPRLRNVEAHLSKVYGHYPAEEIASAPENSQLGHWREGMEQLRHAIQLMAQEGEPELKDGEAKCKVCRKVTSEPGHDTGDRWYCSPDCLHVDAPLSAEMWAASIARRAPYLMPTKKKNKR